MKSSNLKKKIEHTPSAGEKTRISGRIENLGKCAQVNIGNFFYWFLIFWREKLRISTRCASKIGRSKIHQIAISPHYISRGCCVFAKKIFFSSQIGLGKVFFHLKWPGAAIWLMSLPKKQKKTKNKILAFFHYFSPLSWLQALRLLWNHCGLTKKSFWIIQVGF